MKTLEPFHLTGTRLEPGVTLIEASAGTGKTFTIASIVLRLVLEQHIRIEQILAVTYTVAATEELRDRVRERLRHALDDLRLGRSEDELVAEYLGHNEHSGIEQGIRDLDLAVQNFDDARIFTIHGFCQRVLHDFAFESGILFNMELLTDAAPVFEEVALDFWRKQFYQGSAFLSRLAIDQGKSSTDWIKLLQKTLNHPDLVFIPAPEQTSAANIAQLIERKFAEIASEWSKNRAEIIQILKDDKNLSRDKTKNFSPSKILLIEANLTAVCTNFLQASPECLGAISRLSRTEIEQSTKKNRAGPKHHFFDLCEDFRLLTSRYFHQLDHEFLAYAKQEMPLRKVRMNVLTYDDLLACVRDALSHTGGALAQALRARYRAALIDEFQDTDPVQYDIFDRVFSGGRHYLFFIGDPKQAIYGFRGADVFTYLRAAGAASRGFTLETNYRSEKRLLDGINQLFTNVDNPFFLEGIEYRPVHPPQTPRANFSQLVEIDQEGPLRFRLLSSDNGELTRTEAESQICDAVVADIARLQSSAPRLADRHLKFSDMAVLVRTNAQAAKLQNLLRRRGIKSVLKAEESVFKTAEASEMLRLLEAVLDPGRESLLKTALATRFFGLRAANILELDTSETQWQIWLEKFLEYRSLWEETCFIALFRFVLIDQTVRQRLVQDPSGERILTNFLHLAELIHQAETEQRLTPYGVCAWLRQRSSDSAKTIDADQLRLESDDDAVLLATVHKSKGLEYPIVFCPFFWKAGDSKNPDQILFHDPANKFCLTFDQRNPRPKPDENVRLAGRESRAESLRLLYVALTRAQNRCYVYAGDISGFKESPLAHILGNESALCALKVLAEKSDGAIGVTLVNPVSDSGVNIQRSEMDASEELAARLFRGVISKTQMIASFTGLTAGREEEEPDRDAVEVDNQMIQGGFNDLAGFERGVRTGLFLHDILEHLDFQVPDQIDQLVPLKLATHGIAGKPWSEALCAQLRRLLVTPLLPGLTLNQIALADRLSEVEFSFPIASLHPGQLQQLFIEHGGPDLPAKLSEGLGRLRFREVEGFMRGFVDLMFLFAGKYYIVDWKSNWLGSRPTDYDGAGLLESMLQHSYFLQYHLYTVAADLYLRRRLAGYEYDKHFGGVFYIFFRGVDPEKPTRGIFRGRPKATLVDALRQLLIGGLS